MISEFYFWDDVKRFIKVNCSIERRILTIDGTVVSYNEVPYSQTQTDFYYEYSDSGYDKLCSFLKMDFGITSDDVESTIEAEFFNGNDYDRLQNYSDVRGIPHIYKIR